MGWVVNDTPRPLYPRERPGTHCIGGWVGHRAGLNGCGRSLPTGIRSPDRPARSESLYRLSYPGSYNCHNTRTFTIQVLYLVSVEFLLFIKSQFTTNVQNILHLNQCTHAYV